MFNFQFLNITSKSSVEGIDTGDVALFLLFELGSLGIASLNLSHQSVISESGLKDRRHVSPGGQKSNTFGGLENSPFSYYCL